MRQSYNIRQQYASPFLHFFHRFSAAAGDDLTCFDLQGLAADGAVNDTVLFCPDNQLCKSF